MTRRQLVVRVAIISFIMGISAGMIIENKFHPEQYNVEAQ